MVSKPRALGHDLCELTMRATIANLRRNEDEKDNTGEREKRE
jgi:hypothetical protein